MEMLSYIGQLAARRKKLEYRAQELLSGRGSVEAMEKEMLDRNLALVERLRRSKIRFTEFQRVAADETLTAAIAGLMLGTKTRKLTDAQYAQAAKSLPYLWKFFNDIQKALSENRLISYSDYAEVDDLLYDLMIEDPDQYEMLLEVIDDIPTKLLNGNTSGSGIPASWEGVLDRMSRYLATPIYGFAAAGEMALAIQQGNTKMRRSARNDKRTCPDCINYDAQGWMPIGALPPPGERCRCHDRCRCELFFM